MEQTPPAPRRRGASRLDGRFARFGAFCVLLLVAASLGWIHRDRLLPPDAGAAAADDPAVACLARRAADIDRMRSEATITTEQAVLFKSRAEALCRAQAGQGAGPPPPPRE